MSDINVLFVGESWFYETTEYKGFDSFTTSGYQTAVQWMLLLPLFVAGEICVAVAGLLIFLTPE